MEEETARRNGRVSQNEEEEEKDKHDGVELFILTARVTNKISVILCGVEIFKGYFDLSFNLIYSVFGLIYAGLNILKIRYI